MSKKEKFLQEISIKSNFYPFKKGDLIPLWWEEKLEQFIKINLKSWYNEDITNKSGGLKINCIIWNNWWWKSRFFQYIFTKSNNLFKNYDIYLDDFFLLWYWAKSEFNINRYILTWNKLYWSDNNSYIYNYPLMVSYLINKEIWINLLNIFSDKRKIISEKFIFWSWWNIEDLTSLFRRNFLYWNLEKEIEKKIDNISFDWNATDFFHISWDWVKYYLDILVELREKNNITWKNKYKILINFILDRFLQSNFNKHKIFDWDFNEQNIEYYKILLKEISVWKFKFSLEEFLNTLNDLSSNHKAKLIFIEFISTNVFYIINKKFNNDESYKFSNFSWWEQLSFLRFTNMYWNILFNNSNKTNFLMLIDEPDLHLHFDRQKKYITRLVEIFSTLAQKLEINLHFILAPHSPFIISDLPQESIILLDKSETNKYKWDFTEIKKYPKKSFWANFIDIINDWFFFDKKVLMWSFAEDVICKIAEEERNYILEKNNNFKELEEFKEEIWDKFLKNNLLYFKWKNENNN